MPTKQDRPNPLKLNKLQLKTLVLAQVLIREGDQGEEDPETGDVTLRAIPHAHGDHVHLGPYTVSSRDISGFTNPAVWVALMRKGLARGGPPITLTKEGVAYNTGLDSKFAEVSDH